MDIQWNADLLLTQHYETPIRFYLHGQTIDLTNIRTHIYDRINGIDSGGKHHLLHKKDILFAHPIRKISDVKSHITVLESVKNLKLDQKTDSPIPSCIDDQKLQSIVGTNTALVTRGGQVIQGELAAFDDNYLFMNIQKEIVLVYRSGLIGFREDVVSNLKQNNLLDELRKKREKWVEANRENGFEDGIKKLLTDLYPDNAHFIYELLQNAEDAGASEVRFLLEKDRAIFEHNGDRLFSLTDVEAITSIGFSTKKDDHTSIGKFGIGFKAVFAYTSTPEVESGDFHFRIRDMVVPDTSNLFPANLGEEKTRFIFPFDNPKKPSENARVEIEKNLQQLNENTLLFLSNIRKIEYILPDSTKGLLELKKNTNDSYRIKISVMNPGNLVPASTHFLRFEKIVSVRNEEKDELKKCKIAVAFGLHKTEEGKWKVISLNPGQVCIYFPAVKETSNLKFHMHAPFASTVARDSVRECQANDDLRDHLAVLVAESMHAIRDRGLLDVEFLATLPNNRDNLSPFYLPIQEQLIKEFNREKLVPMKQGGYATASAAYRTARGERSLSNLIEDEDLGILLERDSSSPMWITNPPQINQREDNFLSMLDISEWTVEDIIELLETQSDTTMEWLKQKSDEWHQYFYAFLEDSDYASEFSDIPIVRCEDGIYRPGYECYFFEGNLQPDEDLFDTSAKVNEGTHIELDEEESQEQNFYYVSHTVYSSGNNKNQQQKARKFLDTIGVKSVDDTVRVKAILKQRYVYGTIQLREPYHKQDMEMFISLVKKEPNKVSLFNNYYIFELEKDGKRTWWYPHKAFLDTPYINTGLRNYHEILDKDSDNRRLALSSKYEKFGINLGNLVEFAIVVGVQTKLEAIKRSIPYNDPNLSYLRDQAEGQWRSQTGNSEDYIIPELKILYVKPSLEKSKLIWRTMLSLPEKCLKAWYWNNNIDKQRGRPPGKSSLIHELKDAKWVPQKDDDTTIFVRPCDASRDQLPIEGFQWPKGYPDDAGDEWLKAIEFSKKTREQKEEYNQRNRQAKELNFDSIEELEKYAELRKLLNDGDSKITVDDLISQHRSQNRKSNPDFPTSTVKNPKLQEKRYLKQIRNKPQKINEERIHNERVTKGEIEQRTALQQWYTNDSGKMICQICKEEMPFKKLDGDYFFIALEALTIRYKNDKLPESHFSKEVEAQYLALCPECAARYNYFVREVREGKKIMEELRNHLIHSEEMEFSVELGELRTSIKFVETHFMRLKWTLHYYENTAETEG